MFSCRCSCVEPSDPTNDTLKYWDRTNVTASEIYWEALEVKVRPTLNWFQKTKEQTKKQTWWRWKSNAFLSEATADIVHSQPETDTCSFSTLKWHALPDGGSRTEEIKGMWPGLYWITHANHCNSKKNLSFVYMQT